MTSPTIDPQQSPRQRSLSTYEGWTDFAERPPRARPEKLTRAHLDSLPTPDRTAYDLARRVWHANILLRTRQVEDIEL